LYEISFVSNDPGQISYINHPIKNDEEEAQSEVNPENIIKLKHKSLNYNQQTKTNKQRVHFANNLVTDV